MGVYAAESNRIARLHKDLSATIRAAQADDGYLNTFYQNPLSLGSTSISITRGTPVT